MPHFFSNKRLILLMVSIIVLVSLIGFSTRNNETITWPEKFLRDTTGVVQSLVSRPAHMTAGFFGNVADIFRVYEENQMLKSRMEEFASLSAELETVKQENATLREMIDSESSLSDYTTRSALVIHRSPDKWTDMIGINKGSQNGVSENMAVVTPEGLIGKVETTSEFTSTVQLLSDDSRANRVSAMVATDGEPVYAFIEGWNEEQEGLMLRKIQSDAEIEEGQQVITSGLGGLFPRGLAIGTITSLQPDEYGLSYNALVEPAADYYNLEQVNVIERTSETLDETIQQETGGESNEEQSSEEEQQNADGGGSS
ncbi:rod shape-determining protein MreC [Salibacterium halotolerans]|uniref:Cell shape-determining protein MreC n=1 Tax=Salibacterium halotolerans TaxID=1884432 RepID=A0A1I5SUL9_9BACI|nr:rod shape-determining protein MreC [Salibacterium halotolerans]SFP74197.1 rod shape-determining protein MreC [Salibacterium halotolerans]